MSHYERAERAIVEVPVTYYPALLTALLEVSYEKGTWAPGGAGRFVKNFEERTGNVPKLKVRNLTKEEMQDMKEGDVVKIDHLPILKGGGDGET